VAVLTIYSQLELESILGWDWLNYISSTLARFDLCYIL
jgi:hypothetical protein